MGGSELVWGMVGHVDDNGEPIDLGDSTNDGNNLVRVTVFRGRDASVPLDQSQAQGHQLLCQLADGVRLPDRGTRVMVAIPEHYGNIPGGSVIIAAVSNNWKAQANSGAGDMVLQVPGSPAAIFIRKNGTIVLKTADANGNTTSLAIAPGKLSFVDQRFKIIGDDAGLRLRHYAGATLNLGAIGLPGPLAAFGSRAVLKAARVDVDGSNVNLGTGPVMFPAAYGPDPSPAPLLLSGILSAGVKIGP